MQSAPAQLLGEMPDLVEAFGSSPYCQLSQMEDLPDVKVMQSRTARNNNFSNGNSTGASNSDTLKTLGMKRQWQCHTRNVLG